MSACRRRQKVGAAFAFAMLRDLSTEVATMNSLWLSVAVALTMAAVVASPFVQPEMDALQCLCFCCS